MLRSLIASAAVLIASLAVLPATTQAASAPPQLSQSGDGALHKTQGRVRYCIDQRIRCTRRWGFGSRRYRACVRRAGCGIGVYSCRQATLLCTRRHPRNSPLWNRCMRRRGC